VTGTGLHRRWKLIAGVAAGVIAVLVVAWALTSLTGGRVALDPTQASGGADSATSSSGATASAAATASATASGTGGSAAQPSSTASGSGGATGGPSAKKPRLPSPSVLSQLRNGEWRIYDAQVVSAGTQSTSGARLDISGIEIDAEAATKVSGGYGHGTVHISLTASGPPKGSGAWMLFGTWTMLPDGKSTDKQQYSGGIGGALSGQSSVRPPAAGGKMTCSFNPIGAYSPAGRAIEGGSFNGDARFEGVLYLPSVPPPPASKL
jgi:hypothetical protein